MHARTYTQSHYYRFCDQTVFVLWQLFEWNSLFQLTTSALSFMIITKKQPTNEQKKYVPCIMSNRICMPVYVHCTSTVPKQILNRMQTTRFCSSVCFSWESRLCMLFLMSFAYISVWSHQYSQKRKGSRLRVCVFTLKCNLWDQSSMTDVGQYQSMILSTLYFWYAVLKSIDWTIW